MWYYMYPEMESVWDFPFFLHSIGLHELQPHIIRPSGYAFDQFFYSTKGSGYLILSGTKIMLPAGCGFFIPANIPHEYHPLDDFWNVRWMVPSGFGLSNLYTKLGLTQGGRFLLQNTDNLDIILNNMRESLLTHTVYGNFYASAQVQEFIIEFAHQAGLIKEEYSPAKNDKSTYQKHMDIIIDYVEFHFMTHISPEELCNLVNVSPQHLCRILRTCTGMTPMEYINSIRIQKAKEMLLNSSETIWKIGEFSGFENTNYFCRIFKKFTGTTPGEYRKSHQKT